MSLILADTFKQKIYDFSHRMRESVVAVRSQIKRGDLHHQMSLVLYNCDRLIQASGLTPDTAIIELEVPSAPEPDPNEPQIKRRKSRKQTVDDRVVGALTPAVGDVPTTDQLPT